MLKVQSLKIQTVSEEPENVTIKTKIRSLTNVTVLKCRETQANFRFNSQDEPLLITNKKTTTSNVKIVVYSNKEFIDLLKNGILFLFR